MSLHISGVSVLDRVDLTVHSGEHVAVLGTNGAGKSSLLRALLGLMPAQWKKLVIAGQHVRDAATHRQALKDVAWIPQSPVFGEFPVTACELFDLVNARAQSIEMARRLGVHELVDLPIREVSGGQLQRLLLARAFGQLAQGCRLLLADEPSTGLDRTSLEILRSLLRESNVATLVITHDEQLLSVCDRAVRIEAGKLVEP